MSQSTKMLYLALILSLMTSSTFSQQTAGRSESCCGFMSGKIYCYGGNRFTSGVNYEPDDVMNMLDLTNRSGASSNDLQNSWRSVTYLKDNVDTSPREAPQCVAISELNRMIVIGGFTLNQRLNNANILYDAPQNRWFTQPDYIEPPYGRRQIYWASSSYVPGKGIAVYGGVEVYPNRNWTLPYLNVSNYVWDRGTKINIGYTQVSYFNVDNLVPSWSTPVPVSTATDWFPARHQSVFDPVNNTLLFMGGIFRNSTSDQPISKSYRYIRTFNTVTNEWGRMNLTGDYPNSDRVFSTLTLLPSTNRHVLLYGGEIGTENGVVADDYCSVLNLDTQRWTRQRIDAPAGTGLQRSKHSAVIVNNNTLFILWGIDNNQSGTSSVLILNVSNPDAITASEKYIDPNAPNAAEDSNGNTLGPDNVSPAALSSGAKAGIAVAAVVVVILGALVVWLCLRNKKNERIRRQHELAKQQQHEADYYHPTDNAEPMEVDWDQIEAKYTEMPATKHANNSEQFSSVRESAQSTTVVDGGEHRATTTNAVHPDAVDVQRPNAMDPPLQSQRVLKPDGGY